MSDYSGAGIYRIVPMNALTRSLNVWGGGATVGTPVKLYTADNSPNSLFEIVAAGGDGGNPEVGDRQYHLLGVDSGLMLCAAQDGSDSGVTVTTRNVKHGSARWKLIPVGNGSFYFASVLNTNKYLAVSGAQDADGAIVMTYAKNDAPNFQFKLQRLPDY